MAGCRERSRACVSSFRGFSGSRWSAGWRSVTRRHLGSKATWWAKWRLHAAEGADALHRHREGSDIVERGNDEDAKILTPGWVSTLSRRGLDMERRLQRRSSMVIAKAAVAEAPFGSTCENVRLPVDRGRQSSPPARSTAGAVAPRDCQAARAAAPVTLFSSASRKGHPPPSLQSFQTPRQRRR